MAGAVLVGECSKKEAIAREAGTQAKAEATSPASNEPVEMRFKWVVGKKYTTRVVLTEISETSGSQLPQPMRGDTKEVQDYAVSTLKEREGGGKELELEFLSQKVSTKMGDREVLSFDSTADAKDDAAKPGAASMRKMVGAKIKFLTDAKGRVEKVEGVDELLKRMTADASPELQQMFKGMVNEDILKQRVDSQYMPEKPLKIGDVWPVKTEMNLPIMGTLITNIKFTFTGWEQHENHKCAVVTFDGDITSKPGATQASPMVMTVEGGKISGKSWFDPEIGMGVGTLEDNNMTLKMNVHGQSLSTGIRQKMNFTLLQVADAGK